MKKRVVVGALPEPIGGVSNFIFRLASGNLIKKIIDIYPSEHKKIPSTYKGSVLQLKGLFSLYFHLLIFGHRYKKEIIHFNFSRSRSLIFFLLLPKVSEQYELTLHHGVLSPIWLSRLFKVCLRNFDRIYSLSAKQASFYESVCDEHQTIVETSSYVKYTLDNKGIDLDVLKAIEAFFGNRFNIVASGTENKLYNHEWVIKYAQENRSVNVALFVYGDDYRSIELLAKDVANVQVFPLVNVDTFNRALTLSSVYVRPTLRDSFGIAVADAYELGVPVLASDVCDRFPGVYIFNPDSYDTFSKKLTLLIENKTQELDVQVNKCFSEFKYIG